MEKIKKSKIEIPLIINGKEYRTEEKGYCILTKKKDAAGNFYINDKPTGSIIKQQPFGASRASDTKDKARK